MQQNLITQSSAGCPSCGLMSRPQFFVNVVYQIRKAKRWRHRFVFGENPGVDDILLDFIQDIGSVDCMIHAPIFDCVQQFILSTVKHKVNGRSDRYLQKRICLSHRIEPAITQFVADPVGMISQNPVAANFNQFSAGVALRAPMVFSHPLGAARGHFLDFIPGRNIVPGGVNQSLNENRHVRIERQFINARLFAGDFLVNLKR